MSYVRAEEVLPKELVEAIQRYVSGKSVYIPCRQKKSWGSQNKTRQYYRARNAEIEEKRRQGASIRALAAEYALSEKSIQRILHEARASKAP